MTEIWNLLEDRVGFGDYLIQLGLSLRAQIAQFATFFLASFALGRVHGLADRLADLVRLPVEVVHLLLFGLPRLLEAGKAVHVGAANSAVRSFALPIPGSQQQIADRACFAIYLWFPLPTPATIVRSP